jgi:threonine dehydratase
MVTERDAMLHPFDDPLLWEGHATLVDEIVRSGEKPEAIVVSVGGGGLLSGVVEGLRRHDWTNVPVVAVETVGADSLARSLEGGHLVTLDAITSIATSLGAKQVAAPRSTQPTCDDVLACSSVRKSSSTVRGLKALRQSARSNAILTVFPSWVRW